LPNLLPLQKPPPKVPAATSIPASHPSNKKEPFEQALRFCKNASKALTRKDIPNARNNLLAAIILSKKQKNVSFLNFFLSFSLIKHIYSFTYRFNRRATQVIASQTSA